MKNNFCYIHIPFCSSKCKYCRFASFGNSELLKINLYVEKLVDEINKSSYSLDNNKLHSIYFGGGTPSVLSINHLEKIINTIKNKHKLDEKIEINIEATPITITKENIEGWIKTGVNRISIGVQSLNTDTLKEIGRGEKGDIIQALENINDFNSLYCPHPTPLPMGEGIDQLIAASSLPLGETERGHLLELINKIPNISIDFIIGLPHVKKGEIKKDIEYILDKYDFINHISVYMLEEYYDEGEVINEEGEKDSKFQNVVYPNDWKNIGISEEYYLDEYVEIKDYLKMKGFNSYEISNFAREGYDCKHNKSYWDHSNVIGYGLGAHSFVNNVRFSNSEEFVQYYSGITSDFEVLDNEDLFIEKIMFGLRTNGINKEIYEKLEYDKLLQFKNEGLLHLEDDVFKLTDRGVMLLDYILRELI